MHVPVESRVVRQNLEATTDEQDQEQEIDVVGDAQPGREAVRLHGCFGSQCGTGRHRRKTDGAPLDVRGSNQEQRRRDERQEALQPDPHDETLFPKQIVTITKACEANAQ